MFDEEGNPLTIDRFMAMNSARSDMTSTGLPDGIERNHSIKPIGEDLPSRMIGGATMFALRAAGESILSGMKVAHDATVLGAKAIGKAGSHVGLKEEAYPLRSVANSEYESSPGDYVSVGADLLGGFVAGKIGKAGKKVFAARKTKKAELLLEKNINESAVAGKNAVMDQFSGENGREALKRYNDLFGDGQVPMWHPQDALTAVDEAALNIRKTKYPYDERALGYFEPRHMRSSLVGDNIVEPNVSLYDIINQTPASIKSTSVHEFTHAADHMGTAYPGFTTIMKKHLMNKERSTLNLKMRGYTPDDAKYLAEPEEQWARLQELRHHVNKSNPYKKISPDDIANIDLNKHPHLATAKNFFSEHWNGSNYGYYEAAEMLNKLPAIGAGVGVASTVKRER